MKIWKKNYWLSVRFRFESFAVLKYFDAWDIATLIRNI